MEKEQGDSPALIALESDNSRVIQGDWRLLIDVEVATDLRKYRSYRGESVRDLLRALRNKVELRKRGILTSFELIHISFSRLLSRRSTTTENSVHRPKKVSG